MYSSIANMVYFITLALPFIAIYGNQDLLSSIGFKHDSNFLYMFLLVDLCLPFIDLGGYLEKYILH